MASILRRGFSLAEAILAVGMAVTVVLLVMALALSAGRANQKSSDTITATGLAQAAMENFVYSLPPSADPFWTQTSFASPYQQDLVHLSEVDYLRAYYLSDLSSSGGPAGGLLITVRVSWESGLAGRDGQGLQSTSVSRLIYAH
jgi:hypothetical protein